MKKRDRAIVAVILAAALIVGLVLVRRALDRAVRAQADSLASAQFNGGAGEASSSGEGDGAPAGEGDASAGDASDPQNGGEEPDAVPPEDGAQEGEEPPGGSSQAGSSGVTGDPPSAGGGEMTLAQLSQWMQNESSGALAARNMLEAEQALAAGVGTADDALRRTFAQSQAQQNDEARRNQLSEEAASLGLTYLQCRDLVALREESAAFYQSLEAAVSAQAGAAAEAGTEAGAAAGAETPAVPDTGRTEQAQADLQAVQEALAAAELALEEARADLQEARDALNTALGNPYGTAIEVTDVLEAEPLPALTGDEAAAQALAARNEIKGAAYTADREQQALTQLRYSYAPNSPEVLEQQAAVEEALAACSKAESQVEADVRDRLTRLSLQKQKLDQLSDALEKTGASVPQAAYTLESGADGTVWSSNLAQLMGQWAEIENNLASLTQGISQFNLDVLCFQHAVGVGCTAVTI